jgi:hypothetical protein
LRFCVYCGKQYSETDRFCPFCGKPAPGFAGNESGLDRSSSATSNQPRNHLKSAQETDRVPSKEAVPKKRAAFPGKALGIGIGSLVGLGGLAGTVILIPEFLGGEPVELAAFKSGVSANCDRIGSDYQVELSTELDQSGQPMIRLIVGEDEMNWTYEPVAGNFFLFEIDSIYSPSAVRAEKLGCSLIFQAQP